VTIVSGISFYLLKLYNFFDDLSTTFRTDKTVSLMKTTPEASFESSFPQSLGGNPGFLFLKVNGFPITASGMTMISFFQKPIGKAIYETVH